MTMKSMSIEQIVSELKVEAQGAIFFKISTDFGWKDIHIFLSGVEGYS